MSVSTASIHYSKTTMKCKVTFSVKNAGSGGFGGGYAAYMMMLGGGMHGDDEGGDY